MLTKSSASHVRETYLIFLECHHVCESAPQFIVEDAQAGEFNEKGQSLAWEIRNDFAQAGLPSAFIPEYHATSRIHATFGVVDKMVEPYVALQSVMMPSDTNPHGTIFGGVILSNLDMAGAIAAARETRLAGGSAEITFVTVAMNRVEFKQPVFVGDVVRYETTVTKWGRTSITLQINVISDRLGEQIPVTEAEVVYVGVNKMRQPVTLLPSKSSGT